MAAEAIDPLRLLQDDLKEDDSQTVIEATSRLSIIALALGPARIKKDLIPFLMEFASQVENDQAHCTVCQQLGEFTELMGGPQQTPALLPLLEKYCGEEEQVVRDAGVDAINKLTDKMGKADVAAKVVPLVRKLAGGEWFTQRVSAAGLFAAAYPKVPDQAQAELKGLYLALCNDETPMVRKAAYGQLEKFGTVVAKPVVTKELIPVVKALTQDDADNIRLTGCDALQMLAARLDPGEFMQEGMPVVDAIADDASWRVRVRLCKQMASLCEVVADPVRQKLLAVYSRILQDKEPEVRRAACKHLIKVANVVKGGLLEPVGSNLEALATDSAPTVRTAFSLAVTALCGVFGKEVSQKMLLPIIIQMAQDEHHEVRNNIAKNLHLLDSLVQNMLPELMTLSKDPKWRVRMAVISAADLLCRTLGKNFEKKFANVLIVGLSDHVYAIREETCRQIGFVVKQLGGKWAQEKLFPQAFSIYDKTTNYLHRMTCLLVIANCAPHCDADVTIKSFLPLVITSCTDDVANVRIAAAQTMAAIVPNLDRATVQAKCQPLLAKMIGDPDKDVVYSASQGLKLC